ncbi:MAG: alpha-amylase family glycosyl hydrolase, partial [Mucinivorans sp.]
MGNILYSVTRVDKVHPAWSYNAVVYELNTRQFTTEGTFAAATKELSRLKKLGVDIIWMMPIFPIGKLRRKGSLGSYYSIADYTEVNEEFGTIEDFSIFVARAHHLGMHVILDWVANHTARDARWANEHPEWYEWDSARGEIATPFDWSDTAKLDYSSLDMRKEMVSSMKYWIAVAAVDGFRCDMAMLVPLDFWDEATRELTEFIDSRGGELFMLAEAEGPEFHQKAFDASYCWELHHIFNNIATGQANAFTLGERLTYENSLYDSASFRLLFTSNHDENSWNGSEWERMGAAAPAFAALTFMLSGMPLIYNGQESALGRKLSFFERDPIDWRALRGQEIAGRMEQFYRDLSTLKRTHPALRAGERGGDIWTIDNSEPWRIFAIKRRVDDRIVIALFNLSDQQADVEFHDEDFSGTYNKLASSEDAQLCSGSKYYMPSWGVSIYYR